MSQEAIQLRINEDDEEMAYLYLPGHPKKIVPGIVSKQARLSDLIENYKGPDIYLDFDKNGTIIGIEIT